MGKKKAVAVVEPDFNAMVAETRAQMQEKAGQAKKTGRKQPATPAARPVLDIIGQRASFPYQDEADTWRQAEGTVFSDSHKAGHMRMALYDAEGGVEYVEVPDPWLSYVGPSEGEEQLGVIGEEIPAPVFSEAKPREMEPEVAPESLKDVATLAELPGTPALLPELVVPVPTQTDTASAPILTGNSVRTIALQTLHASPLNPRKVFEQSALEELAESIAHKGLMQNLVIRPVLEGDSGHYEVVAGGRRLRALQLLAEQGRIPESYMVPVRVQQLSDLEALQLATAENVERRNMSPIEEADAFAGMVALGATPHDIALRFGFSEKTVQQRLVLAEGLGEDGRKLFADGKIGLGQAQIIAQTSGPLRKHVVKAAASGSYDSTVSALQNLIKKGSFLVQHAKFDVAASGLEVIEDLYGDQPARFADPKAALARQLDWVQARARELEGKKEQHFVEVEKCASDYLSPSYDKYTTYDVPKSVFGTVIMVSTVTGQMKEHRCARTADVKSVRAKEQAAERKQASSEATGGEGAAIRKQGWIDGHEARATALRSALVGDHKRAVALTILMMLEAEPVSLRGSLNHVHMVPIPVGIARLTALDEKLGGKLGATAHPKPQQPISVRFTYGDAGEKHALEYLELLMSLSLEELLDIQSVLIAQATGGWNEYNPVHAPKPFMAKLAADTGAVVTFKLTDDHLKAYPRDRLLELAADAGLTYIAGNTANLSTNKDIRAAILEHADALYERGYVPPLARFPEVSVADPEEAQVFADLVSRAETLINDLSQEGLSAVLELDGYDPTDWDTEKEMRDFLREELSGLDDAALKAWGALWSQLPAGQDAAD